MKKMRLGAMAVAIVAGVGAFLGAQRLELIPGPWSKPDAGEMYLSSGVAALAAASAAIAAGPDDYMTYYRRGTQYQLQGQYELALTDLNRAVELSPTPLSLEVLGVRALDSGSRDTHTLGLVFLLIKTRAETLQRLNRPTEAIADLDAAIKLDPRKTDPFYSRGLLQAKTGRYDAAIADFDALLQRRSDVNWYFGRGLAKYFKGEWNGAADDFQQAVRRMPGDNAYLIWLAKAHLRAGMPLQAELFANLDRNGSAWAVVEALMSDDDPAQFVSGVRAGAGYAGSNEQDARCKATVFLGEWLTIRKSGVGAREIFTEAENVCPPLSLEKAVASAELLRVPAGAVTP